MIDEALVANAHGRLRIAKHRARQAPTGTGSMAVLVNQIKGMIKSEADPHVLIGILLEGAVHTFVQGIPAGGQQEVAEAMTELLAARLRSNMRSATHFVRR